MTVELVQPSQPIPDRVQRFIYEPGNGTRYDLLFGRADEHLLLVWLHRGGSGGSALHWSGNNFLHWTYLAEKLNAGRADIAALLSFLSQFGIDVGLPENFENTGGDRFTPVI